MASTSNHPDEEKLIKSMYKTTLMIYKKSTSETLYDFSDEPRVRYFLQSDDPHTTVMPVLKLGVMLNQDERITIQDNRDDLTFNLKIKRIERQWDDELDEYKDVSEIAMLDLEFQAFISKSDDVGLKTEEKSTVEEDEDENLTSSDMKGPSSMTIVKFILSCIEHRNRFKIPINFNATDASKTDVPVINALALGISKCVTGEKTVVLQTPENDKTYNQIIVPPYNLKDFCNHLQTVYGVYKSGLIIYQDLKYLYVIPELSDNYSVPEDEHNKVFIYIYDQNVATADESKVGSYDDTDGDRYVMMQPANYKFVNMGEFEKETTGNIFDVTSDSSIDASVTYEGDSFGGASPLVETDSGLKGTNTVSKDRTRYFNDELDNDFAMSSLVEGLKLKQVQCNMQFRDVDIDIFKFNRIYHIIFNDDSIIDGKYGGDFKLISAKKSLVQGDGRNPMTSLVNCVFAKIQ